MVSKMERGGSDVESGDRQMAAVTPVVEDVVEGTQVVYMAEQQAPPSRVHNVVLFVGGMIVGGGFGALVMWAIMREPGKPPPPASS